MDRSTQPEIKTLDKYVLIEPEVYFLSNGIKVVQFNAGTQDLLRVELIFKAGSWYQAKNFTSLATNLMLREGTSKHSSKEISDILDFYGAHLESVAEKDNAYITLYSLNKHLPNTLPILREIVAEASFPENEYRIFAGKQRQLLQVNLEKVNFLARTRFNQLIYGPSHPYGNFLTTEDIDNFKVEEMEKFHRNHYQPGSITIIIAGKVDPSLQVMLEDAFGTQKAGSSPQEELTFKELPSSKKEHFISKKGSVQSAIRMGRLLFNRHHPDYMGMKVLNTVLGGYFGSRLMTNLREDKGYTYGVGSAAVPLIRSGYFFISCEVGSDATKDSLEQIRVELMRLCDETVKEKELKLVRNYMLGSFLRGIDGPFAMADTYRDIMEDGLGNEFNYAMMEVIRNITPSQLKELACKYLDPADMHLLVVGKKV
ncbi:MAG: insulinase family protein [Bacteroidetes bacterium]|nr:insulinase family protein [Bacteroidota bacterium]